MAVAIVALALLLAGCSSGGPPGGATVDPANSVPPAPDYPTMCAPVGADTTSTCLRLTLEAIDAARAREALRPMVLPSDFPRLTVAEQLFVAIDRERVDRGLPPFTGLVTALDTKAQMGADSGQLPPGPGHMDNATVTEWIGAVDNGLDADYQWMYEDGPESGVPGCSDAQSSGCWVDRQSVLGRLGSRHLVMGAGFDPSGDTSPGDRGGSSLAAILAVSSSRAVRGGHNETYAYTWNDALAAMSAGALAPLRSIPPSESGTGIPDPGHNVAPVPDYTGACAGSGIDVSSTCVSAVLAAINHAHALEGVRPMVLPSGFAD